MSITRVLTILLLAACCTVTRAQDESDEADFSGKDSDSGYTHSLVAPADLNTTRAYQSEDLVLRKFEEEKWKKVIEGTDYSEEPMKLQTMEAPKMPASNPIVKVIAYILIIALVLLIVYFIIRNMVFNVRVNRPVEAPQDPVAAVDDIELLDAQAMLQKAIAEGNYKLAVRLYFLSLLKRLNEKGVITWKKDKTNRDYLGELLSRDFYFDDIRRLTLSYESAWYGEHDVKAEMFTVLSTRFENILNRIDNGEK